MNPTERPLAVCSLHPRRAGRGGIVAALALLGGACHGPGLVLDNPADHPVFLDGVAVHSGRQKFGYYGTRRVDALPTDLRDGMPDPDHVPSSKLVAVPAPVSGWLFPFDFPLELLARSFGAGGDQTLTVTVDPSPLEQRGPEIPSAAIGPLHDRAFAARISR